VRTGVTAILPRGRDGLAVPVFAGTHALNGNGELTGTLWIEESGQCEGPVTITNTHACGLARDTTVRWLVERHPGAVGDWGLPVAGETYDGELNDINGFHVTPEHVFEALDSARGGPLELGSVGGGTGMICYDFKGGSGSASRAVAVEGESYALGAFVQANFGIRRDGELRGKPAGSIIAVIATDAPLLPHQLKRLARRVGLGIARSGGIAHNGSGDIFLAVSTANPESWGAGAGPRPAAFLANERLDPLFEAVVQATDEAVIDSMVANETMVGRDGNTALALPHDRLRDLLAHYGRGPE
jgi:L-aminopeptidase/D-esterase-like protein